MSVVTARLPRVALADDDVLLREGLAGLLERSGYEIVGQFGDASSSPTSFVRTTPNW